MSKKSKEHWNERYRDGFHHDKNSPTNLLEKWISDLPSGKALDVGCGAGRNSIFLAKQDYMVDAIDFSEEAIKRAKKKAGEANLEINWIRKDVMNHNFPKRNYDVIIIDFFHPLDKLKEIKNSLKENGYLLYEHHINTEDDIDHGPDNPKFRYDPNELLEKFQDFQILEYREGIETYENGEKSAIGRLVARKSKEFENELPFIHE